MSAFEPLFEPLEIGSLQAKNHLVFPATASVTGTTTDRGIEWYGRIASGGVGTIIVEGTSLSLFQKDEFRAGLPQLAEAIHEQGALACIQLFQPPQSPSGEPLTVSGGGDGRAPTSAEIRTMVEAFAAAAEIAVDAGFDAAEPHGAHGFFLNQFFSPLTNTRTDEYGGSEGRQRFGLEIAVAVRKALGRRALLFYRHTPEQSEPGGYTLEDSKRFAKELDAAGIDVLDVSPSTRGMGPLETTEPVGEHAGLAAAFREVVNCQIMAVGGMQDPEAAEQVLRTGKADLVAICRGLIADPDWPRKVKEGQLDEIVECVGCNEKCFGNLSRGIPIACTQWKD